MGCSRFPHEGPSRAPGALSTRALAILREAEKLADGSGLVFPALVMAGRFPT